MPRSPRMSLRTRAFTAAYDRVTGRTPVADLTAEQRDRARGFSWPARAPVSWVTGAVPRGVTMWDSRFAARDGVSVPLRLYRPAPGASTAPLPVVVYLHGGGWVLGSTRGYDALCGYLADAVDALVVSVDYRLAPEHPAPQGVHDTVDAVRWLADNAAGLGADGSRLAVCGDSAGGNLAAVSALVMRDEGGPRISHQALLYPGTDATLGHPSVDEHADAPMLTRSDIVGYLGHYLAGTGLDVKDPVVSPFWADDLSGLPPALVQTADLDPLRDEGQGYAARLATAGVPVRATNYAGAPHGFMSIPGVVPAAAQARFELATELRAHLHS
ncbi:MAG: alpha/beta hydrolase [Lapillicoccus sp.]